MATIPSDISQLQNAIQQSGLAFSNRYELMFFLPKGMRPEDGAQLQNLSLRCDAVTIPGRSFSTTPYRIYGPARNMPYEPIYSGEMSISFIVSRDLRERTFFENWMNMICDRENYKFGFYEDYATTVQITVLTREDQPTYSFLVEEVYPKSIGDLQIGYDKDNEFLRQDITLSFRKYTLQ